MNFPIVFATDSNYVTPTYVAIHSLLRHLNNEMRDKIDIYILCSSAIDDKVKEYFSRLHKNIYFEEVRMSNLNLSNELDYISIATYYRIVIPEKLSQYDKCLYLDSDIIVRRDITPLISMDMHDNLIIGCKNYFSKECYTEFYKQRCYECGIPLLDTYVNAGVLLINIKELRGTNLASVMLKDVGKNTYTYNDQDIINKYCYGRIGLFSVKYNFMVQYLKRVRTVSKVLNEDVAKLAHNPVIIHYSTKKKPWKFKGYLMSNYWVDELNHIEDREVLDDIINPYVENSRNSRTAKEKAIDWSKFIFRKYVQGNFIGTTQKGEALSWDT